MNSGPGNGCCPHQRQQELNEICDHHGPKATSDGVGQHEGSHDDQQQHGVGETTGGLDRLIGDDAECLDHLAHGEEGVTDADAVDRQRQQKSLDAPQPGSCRTAVAQLRERRIREHAAAPPERCEHHRHRHMGQPEPPPLPVCSQASRADNPGDVEGGVDGKRGGRHRRTGKPAAETTTGNEIIVFAPIASGQPETECQRGCQIHDQNGPVDGSHGAVRIAAVSPTSALIVSADHRPHPDQGLGWNEGSRPHRGAPAHGGNLRCVHERGAETPPLQSGCRQSD